jgi:hypothetical protein
MTTDKRSDLWRSRAAEALAIAEEMAHPDTKDLMLEIAAGYKSLAEHAEKHEELLSRMAVSEIAKSAPTRASGSDA